MKAQTRFGGIWTFITLILIFAPIAFTAIHEAPQPVSEQNPLFIALAFTGLPIVIILFAIQVPWRKRTLIFNGSSLKMIRDKTNALEASFDANKPFRACLAIREGRMGRYGKVLIRWVQGRIEQCGFILRLEFPIVQTIRPALPPYGNLPGPNECEVLKPLLLLDFCWNETEFNRQSGKEPRTQRGKVCFMEVLDGPEEFVAYLLTHSKNNTWRRDNTMTSIDQKLLVGI